MERVYREECRLQAGENTPLLGGEGYQFGFYDAGIMRHIVDTYGGNYKVYTIPVPQNAKELSYLETLLKDEHVQYALVDKNKVVIVHIDSCKGWMSALTELGYEVHSGDKTNKRLKSAHRPTLLNAHFGPDELKVMLVYPDEFTRYVFMGDNANVPEEYQDPSVFERLLDGGFVISRRIVQQAVANLPMHYDQDHDDKDDYYHDPRVRRRLIKDLLEAKVLNARLISDLGFIKGNCFVSDNLPEGVDVITSLANIKKEVFYNNGYRFLAEPQGPKAKVITDDQTVINFPHLFPIEDVEYWLDEEYKKLYQNAIEGNLLTNWRTIYQRTWKDNETPEENEARARMSYTGYRWTAAGFNINQSPWLLETVATAHAKPLEKRVPIPCAVYEQIVPESLVRMAGYYDFEVDEGNIRRHNELGVHVVNDLDWLEMYESHGGHDQDDFFKLFYREFVDGPNTGFKVVAVRSPNGYGEYSIFNYVPGEWKPTWHNADMEPIHFPKVSGIDWPQRLSDATKNKIVEYTGLPSATAPKDKREGPYTIDDVMRDVRIAMSGGNVGGFVNACMVHSSVIGKHRPVQLCSLEDAIDKCINPDHEADVAAIDEEARQMYMEAIHSGNPIDRSLWIKRGGKRYLKPGEEVELYEGTLTQLKDMCYRKYQEYCSRIYDWAQENARPSDIIDELGKRFYYWGIALVRQFRMGVYNTNTSDETISSGGIQRSSWENMYEFLVDKITSFERFEDRCDYVLGLYSASMHVPTSSGKITDQIVMNRYVFPYLEEALQFYGIAKTPTYRLVNGEVHIDQLKNESWWWPNEDGLFVSYTDPLEFQKAHAQDSPVVFTMEKPKSEPLLKSKY